MIYIYVNNQWQLATVYIYVNNQWVQATGYVYDQQWKEMGN